MRRAGQWLKWGLGVFFSAAVVIWALWALDWAQTWRALAEAHYSLIALGAGLIIVTFWLRVWRWAALLQPAVAPHTILIATMLIGQIVNYVAPVRAGDLLRAYLLGEETGISKAQIFGTVALEKMWDILMLLLFLLLTAWFMPLPPWLIAPARGLISVALVMILSVSVILWRRTQALDYLSRLAQKWTPAFHQRLLTLSENIITGFASVQHSRLVIMAGFWSLLIWISGALTNYVVFLAFDLRLPFVAATLLLVVLQVGVAVPSLPGRIGVFEGLCVLTLALFHVPFDIAFSYGLVLHLVVFVPPVAAAAIFGFQLQSPFSQILKRTY